MIKIRRAVLNLLFVALASITLGTLTLGTTTVAQAETAANLTQDATQALNKLYQANPTAKMLAKHAKAVLVFPKVLKAGLVFGGSYGEGVLFEGGKENGYYNTVSASWGLQAGAQTYGYALFLMSDKALKYLHESHGWEVGVGPSVVVVNAGVAKNLSSSTLQDDAYAFIFDQQGLMASFSLEGTKISRIHP